MNRRPVVLLVVTAVLAYSVGTGALAITTGGSIGVVFDPGELDPGAGDRTNREPNTGAESSNTPTQDSRESIPTATPTRTVTSTAQQSGGYDLTLVRQYFLRYYNQMRAEQELQNVTRSERLRELGNEQATNMARYDYIGHEQPDGDDITDRFRQHGLLPEYQLDVPDSNRYYAGAEQVEHNIVVLSPI